MCALSVIEARAGNITARADFGLLKGWGARVSGVNSKSIRRSTWSACIVACVAGLSLVLPAPATLLVNGTFDTASSGTGGQKDPDNWGHFNTEGGTEGWADESGSGNGVAFYGWQFGSSYGIYQSVTIENADTNALYYFRFRGQFETDYTATVDRVTFEFYHNDDATRISAVTNDVHTQMTGGARNNWTTFYYSVAAPATTSVNFKIRPVIEAGTYVNNGGGGNRAFKHDAATLYDRTLNYRSGEIVEEFSYEGPVEGESGTYGLSGMDRGNGWTNTWSVSAGTWQTVDRDYESPSFQTFQNYGPKSRGNRVKLSDPGNGNEGAAARAFAPITNGKFYAACIMSYKWEGTNKYAGFVLMSNTDEKVFCGKVWHAINSRSFGTDGVGGQQLSSPEYQMYGYNYSGGTGDVYLMIVRYDFSTRVLDAKAYYRTDTVPLTEPGTWDVTDTLASGDLNGINGIRLKAGGTGGNNSVGDVFYDEIRVARSWKELLNQTEEPTWDGTGANANWDTAANWVGNIVPSTGTNVTFYDSISSGANINLNGARTALGVRFNDSADTSLAINDTATIGNALTINGGGIAISSGSGGSHSIASVTLGADQTWTNESAQDFSVTNRLRGTGNLTKTGSGRVVLTYGGTASDFSGTLTINNGPVRAIKGTALGATSAGTTVSSGGALELWHATAGQTYDAEPLTLNGFGVSDGGALRSVSRGHTWAGAITLNSDSRINADADTPTITGGINGNSAGRNVVFGGAGNITITTTALGSNIGTVSKDGAGTLTLSIASTYSDGTIVSNGTMNLGASDVVPNGSALTIKSGGTFGLNGFNDTIGSVAGDGTLAMGTTTLNAGGDNSSTALNGLITGTSGRFVKQGTGTLTLTNANTLGNGAAGGMTVEDGTLSIPTIAAASTAQPLGDSTAADAIILGANGKTGKLLYTGNTASSTKQTTLAASGTGSVDVATSGQTLTLSGVITSSGGLTKDGAGTLALSGANDFTGPTKINTGPLAAQHNTALGTVAGGVIVASGAALQLSGTITIGAEPLTLSGTGISSGGALRNTANNNTYGGAITLGAATRINSDSGTLTLNNATAISSAFGLTFGGAGDISMSTPINTGANTVTKDGAGRLTLSADNSGYTGLTTINAGVIRATHQYALGWLATGTTVDNGAALEISGGITINEPLTLNGTGISSGGALRNISGTTTYGGAITLATATRINSDSGVLSLGADADISGAGIGLTVGGAGDTEIWGDLPTGAATFTKDGTGTLLLYRFGGAVRSWTGATTISAGTNKMMSADAISDSSAVTVASGATLYMNGNNDTVGSIAGAGAIIGGGTLTAGGDNSSTTFSGVMSSGVGLTKAGSGTLTLTGGTSTANGTVTVSAGTLIENTTNASAPVTVSSGGFLYGRGEVQNLTINGRVSAGVASNTVGALKTSWLMLENNGTLQVEFSAMTGTAGTDWDVVNASGTLLVNATDGNDFVIALKGNPTFNSALGYTNTIMTSASLSGFAGSKFTINTGEFTPSLNGGSFGVEQSGNDIRLIFVPLPTPDIVVHGTNLAAIADGDVTPQLADGTDFGNVAVNGGTKTHTFTITNSGTGPLFVDTVAIGGADATNFIVTVQPDTWVVSNLLQSNPDFEDWASGWNGPGANHEFKGEFWGLYPKRGTNFLTMWSNELTYRDFPVSAGSNYMLSVWIASPAEDGLSNQVHGEVKIEWLADTGYISQVSQSFGTNGAYDINIPAGQWFNYTNAQTAPPSASTGRVTLVVWNWGTGTGRGAFDHVQFFKQPGLGTTQTFQVQFNPSVVGSRTATLYITNNVSAKNPYNFTIQGTGTWPGIHVSSATFTTNTATGVNPGNFTFGVTNVGNGTLSYNVTTGYSEGGTGWATNAPGTGSLGPAAGQQHTITFGTLALTAGTYYVTNTITDANASNSPKTVVVTLNVTNGPAVGLIYDWFPNSGRLVGQGGGNGWGANVWVAGNDDNHIYGSGSFATNRWSVHDTSGNKAQLVCTANGVQHWADRYFGTPFTNGVVYVAWMQNYDHKGEATLNTALAGIFFLTTNGNEGPFIGKIPFTNALGMGYNGAPVTHSTRTMENGSGTDYFCVARFDFASGELSANAYSTNDMVAEEPQGYWDLNITLTAGCVRSIAGIRIKGGVDSSDPVNNAGNIYFDELRIGTNFYQVARSQGEANPSIMVDGPRPSLIFLGTNYTVGAVNAATITDAQLVNTADKLDFAILWSNQYGVFLTNQNGSFNIGSRSGRVSPNWDPFSLSGSGVTNSLNLDTNFTGFVGENGAQTVTTYVQNAFNITNSSVGDTYFMTVSAENNNTNNGSIISPSSVSTVPVMRAITINSQLVFTVTDDDSANPVLDAPGLGLRVGSTSIGNLLTDPGFDTGAPWTFYSLASARITNTAGEGGGNGFLFKQTTFGGGNTNDHGGFYQTYTIQENVSQRYIFAIRGREGEDPFDCAQLVLKFEFLDVNNALIYTIETNIVDYLTANWQTFTFSATSTVNSVKVRPIVDFNTANGSVGTDGRTSMWDNARLFWATLDTTNPILRATDGALAQSSAANPFHVTINGYDAYSGLSRGTNSATTQSVLSVANLTTNNVVNYNPGDSTATATNSAAINFWTWSNALGAATIDNFMAGSNIVVTTLRDADSDRTDDQLSISNRTAGYFAVVDDDTNSPLKGYTKLTELLQDTSFETHLITVWTNYADPGATLEYTAAAAETGSFGVLISNNQTVAYVAQWVNVTVGASYILSVRAKRSGTIAQDGYYVKAEQWNGGGAEASHFETNIFNSLTTSFQTFSIQFTVPPGITSNKIVLLLYNPGGEDGNGVVYFDDASFKASVGPPVSLLIGSTNYIGTDETTNAVYNVTDGDLASVSGANPLRIVMAGYDEDSGLARTNVAGSAGSNTSITVVNLTTNNVTNYVASESTPVPTATTHTNIWRWDALSSTERDSLWTAGSNAMRTTLKDADFDRTTDQLSVSNMLLGYLKISDDDSSAPILSGFYASPTSPPAASSALAAGDIAILGYNSLDPDAFTFVTMTLIPSGTVIKFTDTGWAAPSNMLRAGEGAILWSNTAPAGLPFGTIVTVTGGQSGVNSPGSSTGRVLKLNSHDLSATDQLIAYQDTSSSTTFLYAVTWNGGVWQADAPDTSSTALPTGLTTGLTAIALATASSNVYNMAVTNGTRAQILTAISSTSNWTRTPATLPPAGSFSLQVQMTDGDLFNGAWWIAGSVQDTSSGINSNSLISGPDFGVNYDLWSPSNVMVFTDTVFQLQQADGGGRAWPTSIASSVSFVPADVNSLGIWTVRVSAADNDEDRTSDRDVILDTDVLSFNVIDDDTSAPVRVNLLGANLLLNSSFEEAGWWSGIANRWDATNFPNDELGAIYGNYFRTDYRSHGGLYSASIPGQFGPNVDTFGGWYQDVTNSYGNGVVWRAAAWARSDQAWTGYCEVKIEFHQADHGTVADAANWSTASFAIPSNGWVYVSVLATSGPQTVWSRIVLGANSMSTNGSLYFDDAVLQVATNAQLPMDMTVGNVSYYRDGTSTNGNFQVSDADLAGVSPTNLLKFIYRVYDPTSSVARSNSIEEMNYDLGAVPALSNIYWTYSNSLSSANALVPAATSVFAHFTNFTIGGLQTTNFVETGQVYSLLAAISNSIDVSTPNADKDRGFVDQEWEYNNRYGFFVVYDDDGIGPYPALRYIGTGYTFGAIASNVVNDAEMLTGAVDFAYEFADASGVFLTNNNASTSTLAEIGNVTPNWELKDPFGVEYGGDTPHKQTSLFAVAGNGSEFATAVEYNVSLVVFTNNATGTWAIQTSVQDTDNDRGSIVASNGQTVSFDRAIRPNWGMSFTVIDDDQVLPVQETNTYSAGAAMFLYATDTTPGSGGTGTNRLFTITDEEMVGFATNPLRIIFNVYDAYSGLNRGSNSVATNMNITIVNLFTDNVTNYNTNGSSAGTTTTNSTSQWTFAQQITGTSALMNLLMFTTSRVSANIPDADNDRVSDSLWRSNLQFGFVRWNDDDSTPPFLREFGSPNTNAALHLFRGGHPGLGFSGHDLWQRPTQTAITNNDQVFPITDGDLASLTADSPLDFFIWAFDFQNGLGRGKTGPDTNTSLIIGSVIVSNVTEFNVTNSASITASKASAQSTNYWRFTNFTYNQVGGLFTNPGGSNRITLHALNADYDRPGDQEEAYTNLGWLVVSDDDSADPFAYNLVINGYHAGTHEVTDGDLAGSPNFYVRLADNEAGVYTAAALGAFSPPNFDLVNSSNTVVLTNEVFDVLTNELQLLNQSFELPGTNGNLATNWFVNTSEHVDAGELLFVRSNGQSRLGNFCLGMDYNGATNYREEIAQWYDASTYKTGEYFTFGGWIKIVGAITGGQALIKMEWFNGTTGTVQGYSLGTFHTDTGNQWINTSVSDVKSNSSFTAVKCIVEVTHTPGGVNPNTSETYFDDMYVGAYYSVRAQENALSIAYTNRTLGAWSFRWSGQDADNDRTNDTIAIDNSTNVTGNGYQFIVVDDQPGSPTGVNLWVNGGDKETTNVSDQQIRNGQWAMAMRLIDPQGVATSGIGNEWAPNYRMLNNAGTVVHSNYQFTTLTPMNSSTNIDANKTMPDVEYTDVDLGWYTILYSVQNMDDDRPDDRGAKTNFDGIGEGGTNGNQFWVYDDDTNAPSKPANVTVDIVNWTNVNLFNITFNTSTDDLSGIHHYRYDTNVVPSVTVTDGVVVGPSGLVTSELPVVYSNLNCEIGANGTVITVNPTTTNGWLHFSSIGTTGQFWSAEHHTGTQSIRHVVNSGDGGYFTAIGQQVVVPNTNDYPIKVIYSAWFKGDVSQVGNGVTGGAFMKLEFFDAGTGLIRTVGNEYGVDHNGQPLFGVNATAWTNVVVTTTNAPANTRFMRVLMGVSQHGTKLAYTTYWDDVSVTVQVVSAASPSVYSFPMTNALEGIRTNSLFAVDDDDDRVGDRMKSVNTNYITMLDTTPPPRATGVTITNGLDEATEMQLNWTAVPNAGSRAGDNEPLSPWQTYHIFYEECTNCNVTTNSPSKTYTNGLPGLGTNITTVAIISNLNFDSTYRFVIAGQDRVGNMGTLSDTATLSTLNFIVTQGIVAAASRVDISWMASSNKSYDMLWVDGAGYSDSYSNYWTNLMGTVTNSFISDTGSASRLPPQDLTNGLRFYRVSREGQWQTNSSPRRASKEIYVSQAYWLRPGENWLSLPMSPDSNRTVVADIFGTNRLPAGSTIGVATKMSWYGHTLGVSTNTSGAATNVIWLSTSGHWLYSIPQEKSGQDANNWRVPTNEGFNIEIPGSATQKLVVVGRLPTNGMSSVIYGATGETNYSVLCYSLPYRVTISNLGLKGAGFTGGVNIQRSDEIRIMDNSAGIGSLSAPKRRIWLNNTTNFVFAPPFAGSAENYVVEPGEAIIFVRKRPPSITWTNKIYYSIPGKNVNP